MRLEVAATSLLHAELLTRSALDVSRNFLFPSGSSVHFDYANVLVFMALGVVLCALMMGLGALLRPSNPERSKLTTYECGEEVQGDSWINFNIRFYLVALVFVIFDVEVAFIYPVVAVFKQWVENGNGVLALTEIVLFVGILVFGLVYVWVKGDLQWIKTVVEPPVPGNAVRRGDH